VSWAAGHATNAGCEADAPEAAEDPTAESDEPPAASGELEPPVPAVVEPLEDEWPGAGGLEWLLEDDVVEAAFSARLLPDNAKIVITTSATAATAPANMIRRRQ
jgi:hypothetical protein